MPEHRAQRIKRGANSGIYGRRLHDAPVGWVAKFLCDQREPRERSSAQVDAVRQLAKLLEGFLGVVLFGFGSVSSSVSKNEAATDGLKPCPICAERIQPAAIKCRFCGSELPDSFRVTSTNVSESLAPTKNDWAMEQIELMRKGQIQDVYTYDLVARALGGSVATKGFPAHFVVTLDGVSTRLNKFDDLQKWFLDNVASRLSA